MRTGSAAAALSVMAWLGQTCTQAWQPSPQAASLMTGLPRKPAGWAARRLAMNWVPWDLRTAMV